MLFSKACCYNTSMYYLYRRLCIPQRPLFLIFTIHTFTRDTRRGFRMADGLMALVYRQLPTVVRTFTIMYLLFSRSTIKSRAWD